MIMIKYIAIIELLAIAAVLSTNPGVKTVITSNGLSYLDTVAIPLLKEKLQNIQIDDISGSSSVAVIGKIDYTVSNIQLSNLQIGSSDIKTSPTGITVEASDVSIGGSADWKYHNNGLIHVSDSGSADLSVQSTSLSVSVIVDKDKNGHATLRTTGCSLTVGDVSIEFHGGASWLYNLFDDTIASTIKDGMQDKVCAAATATINDKGSFVVESLPDMITIDEVAEISYALVDNPMFTNEYIETDLLGGFMSIANPKNVKLTPSPLPKPTSYDRMMYVWLSDYVANSAGIVYHDAGVLEYNITNNEIPSGSPLQLNTGSLKYILPNLYKQFPEKNLTVSIKSTKPPKVTVVPNSIDFVFTGDMTIDVIYDNNTKVNVFNLGLTMHTDVNVWINTEPSAKQNLSANFTLIKFDLKLISSKIGNIKLDLLQHVVNVGIIYVGLPLLNRRANTGLVLPIIDGMAFKDSQITLNNGYILIDTDFQYNIKFMNRA